MIVVLSALLALVAAQCSTTITCVSEGEPCDRVGGGDRLCYGGKGSCSGNSTLNYVCQLQNPAGVVCVNDGNCQTGFDGFSYVCEQGVCVMETGLGLGVDRDHCRNDDDCVGTINCVDGTCRGLGFGEDCTISDECDHRLYCDGTACRRRHFDEGTLCVMDENCDHFWETCGNDDGVRRCYDIASRDERQTCRADSDCGDGLYCSNYDGRCAVAPVFDYSNVAYNNCTSEPEACNGGRSASCACSNFNPSGLQICVPQVQDCHFAMKDVQSCLEDNECHFLSRFQYNDSCAVRHCLSAQQALDDCTSQTDAARLAFGSNAATCFPSYGASYSAADSLLSIF